MLRSTETQIHVSVTRDVLSKEEFSVSNVRIMTFKFMLNVAGLLPPDSATPLVRFMYKIFVTGILILYFMVLLGQLIALGVYWGNISLIANTMSVMNGLIITIVTCIHFLKSRSKFTKLIDVLRMEFVSKVKSKYMKFVVNAERQVKISVALSCPIILNCWFMWTVAPFLNNDHISDFEIKNDTTRGNDLQKMLFVIWTPFDITESPQFQIIFGLQFVFACLTASMLHAVDTMFLSLMSHAAAQFKILGAMLNDMHENISENGVHSTTDGSFMKEAPTSTNDSIPLQNWSGTNEDFGNPSIQIVYPEDAHLEEDQCRQYLVDCIRYHQAIIE
jgi:hypothetical protein